MVVARGVWGSAIDPKTARQVVAGYSITTGLGSANHANHARANRINEMAYSTEWAKRSWLVLFHVKQSRRLLAPSAAN